MTEEKRNAVVRRPPGAVENVGTGASSILSRVVSDALAVARSQEKSLTERVVASLVANGTIAEVQKWFEDNPRFRIGNRAFRGPDYRQILLWAEALKIDPIMVVQRLENASLKLDESQDGIISFLVDGGAIVSAVWDFESLPLASFEWVEGLSICEIAFKGSPGIPMEDLSLHLPFLRRLVVAGIKLNALDLSNVPELGTLWCHKNQLTELDLSNVPELRKLWCHENQLTKLDLSNVPKLGELDCYENKLTELDLSNVPELHGLSCGANQITELDLSNVPHLGALSCHENQLTELDLSNVPELTTLYCYENKLAELDLSNVPKLNECYCRTNQLSELDLSDVPELRVLACSDNELTELDLSNVPQLIKLYCHENQLTELDLSNVPKLSILWCHENQLTKLDLSCVPKLSELDSRGNLLTELDLSDVPALNDQNGPHCRDYHTGPDDRKRFLKYRACDPFVKMKGVRTW